MTIVQLRIFLVLTTFACLHGNEMTTTDNNFITVPVTEDGGRMRSKESSSGTELAELTSATTSHMEIMPTTKRSRKTRPTSQPNFEFSKLVEATTTATTTTATTNTTLLTLSFNNNANGIKHQFKHFSFLLTAVLFVNMIII